MEENLRIQNSFKESIYNGITLGGIHCLVYFILYFFFPSKLTGFSYLFFVIFLNLGYNIFKIIDYRKTIGDGFIDFGKAFKLTFFTLLISGFISSLIVPIILSLLDNNFSEVLAQSQFDTSIYWAQKLGAPEESIDQMKEKMDMDELKKGYTFSKLIVGFGIASIFYSLAAVIVGFIVRRSQPEVI